MPLLRPQDGFAYGSGFEAQPDLLDEIAGHCQWFGNSAQTVRSVKDPEIFFGCLERHHIPCPSVAPASFKPSDGSWLYKQIGGTGGVHVRYGQGAFAESAGYWQQQVPGLPCSLLFLANGRDAVAVGFHRQWLAPAPEMPFRYGGATSQWPIPAPVRAALLEVAALLVPEFGLRGLNSLDFMLDGSAFQVLEVNPRLSASFALHDAAHSGAGLLAMHLSGCTGAPVAWCAREDAGTHLVYYAPSDLVAPSPARWPEWVVDRPTENVSVPRGSPLCTVTACAETALAAEALARRRVIELRDIVHHYVGN